MYKILCDNSILYHPLMEDYPLTAGKLQQEVNKAGTLTLTVPEENKHYSLPKLRTSIVSLYDNDKIIFKGTPLSPTVDLYGSNELVIAGVLFFLNDSIQLPLDSYYGSVEELFSRAINYHNTQVEPEKRFTVGTVTVVNNTETGNITRSSEKATSTWDFLQSKLIKPLGGYLRLRYEENETIIDYLSDITTHDNQNVEQCINLIEAEQIIETEDVASILLPYGSKIKDEEGNETKERITVAEVNNGSMFVPDFELIKAFGRITKTVIWDDVTLPANLLKKARQELAQMLAIKKIELSAADLSKAGYNVSSFTIGNKVRVNIPALKVDQSMMIKKLSIDLLEPSTSSLQLGSLSKTLTNSMVDSEKTLEETVIETESLKEQSKTSIEKIKNQEITFNSKLQQTINQIMSRVSEEHLTKTETQELIESVSTEFSQTAEGFELNFNNLKKVVEDQTTDWTEQKKYISFKDGNIVIGEENSPLTAVHTKNSLEFRYNNVVISVFTHEGLITKNITAENRINVGGKWILTPGTNDNLDLKWIGG